MNEYLELVWWIKADQTTEELCLRRITASFSEPFGKRSEDTHVEYIQRIPLGECSAEGYLEAVDFWFTKHLTAWQILQEALPRPALTSAFFRTSCPIPSNALVTFLKEHLSGSLSLALQNARRVSPGHWGVFVGPTTTRTENP